MPGLYKDCIRNNLQGHRQARDRENGTPHAYIVDLGYREDIDRKDRGGLRLPEFLFFSNLIEFCRIFQILYEKIR